MKKRTVVVLVVLGALLVLVGVALVLLRVVFFVPFKQPSSSMYPSSLPDSLIFANRADRTPAYGAVLVFKYPENPAQDFDKRVVGLPGDRVETRGTLLFIDGWEVPHCLVGKQSYDDADTAPPHHEGTLEVEWLGDEAYLVFHDEGREPRDAGPFTVKSGEYFVIGDNRENSHDSRYWFGGAGGGVPNENTVGRVHTGTIRLPRGAEALRPALDACLAKKPAKTRPK